MPIPPPLSLDTGIGRQVTPSPCLGAINTQRESTLDCSEMFRHQLDICMLQHAGCLRSPGSPGVPGTEKGLLPVAASPTPNVFLGWHNLCPSLQVDASEATSEHDQPCLLLSGAAFVLECLLPSRLKTHLPPLPTRSLMGRKSCGLSIP